MKSPRPAALSASSSREYLQCPLKYRYSQVDRIPQPPTVATIRGTLVHAVLENLFDLAPSERSWDAANSLLEPAWQKLSDRNPAYQSTIDRDSSVVTLFAESKGLLGTYFALENPEFLAPAARESFVEARLSSGLLLRGIIDRIDKAPDGRLRVVDYKTGKSPSRRFMEEALFQMRFYVLLLEATGQNPTRLQLLYLKDGQVLTLDPIPEDIARFEQELHSVWQRIHADATSGNFTPRQTPLCNWCPFQSGCPLFGGQVPRAKEEDLARILAIGPAS